MPSIGFFMKCVHIIKHEIQAAKIIRQASLSGRMLYTCPSRIQSLEICFYTGSFCRCFLYKLFLISSLPVFRSIFLYSVAILFTTFVLILDGSFRSMQFSVYERFFLSAFLSFISSTIFSMLSIYVPKY